MIAEKELETTQNKERLAEEIRQALVAEMRKAIAEQKWERLSSVITLMRGSF
jgi:outer membrane lipopolysaccharide assembly protein LptE/RlpB